MENLVIACGCGSNAGQMTVKMIERLNGGNIKTITLEDLKKDISAAKNFKGTVIALEGCPMECISAVLKPEGIKAKIFPLAENGIVKGITKITGEIADNLTDKVKSLLN